MPQPARPSPPDVSRTRENSPGVSGSAIEEVFPSEGPVKVKIVGDTSREVEEQADRVKNHMNYQILDQDRSYFWQVDQMLFYLPLGGSAFKKTYFDSVSEMVVSRFIKSPDFIVPYIATDLASSPRYTHRMYKNTSEMKKLFASGFWQDIELPKITPFAADTLDDRDRQHQDEADSRSADIHPDDAVYTVYECHCDLELENDVERYQNNDGRYDHLEQIESIYPQMISPGELGEHGPGHYREKPTYNNADHNNIYRGE